MGSLDGRLRFDLGAAIGKVVAIRMFFPTARAIPPDVVAARTS